jgi:hypothetical protein
MEAGARRRWYRRAAVAAVLILLAAVPVQAGILAPAEGPLSSDEANFASVEDATAQCPGGIEAGAAAVDVTPGHKRADGSYDLWQEPYEDTNGNGVYDAPNPLDPTAHSDPYTDTNDNGKWDGPFMAGYGQEKEDNEYYIAEEVHDPVWARAIVLQCGDLTYGAVSVDTVGLFRGFGQDVRDRVGGNFDHVTVASTHTHDSIDTMGFWGPNLLVDGKDPRTIQHYKQGVVAALESAKADLTDVDRVEFGAARTRNLIEDAGTLQTDLRDPFVIDDRILTRRYVAEDGSSIATVVNWAPHPETLAGTKSEISSDYPHALREAIESQGATVGGEHRDPLGGTAIFFSGAVGGMMTTLGAEPKTEDGRTLDGYSYEKANRIGEVAAWAALGSLDEGESVSPDELRVAAKEKNIPVDNPFITALNTIGIFDRRAAFGPAETDSIAGKATPPSVWVRIEVNLVELDDSSTPTTDLQALTVPGELLPEVALGNPLDHVDDPSVEDCYEYDPLKLKFNQDRANDAIDPGTGQETPGYARVVASKPSYPKEPPVVKNAEGRNVMLFGLANDELGYIVSADDFVEPSYYPSPSADGRDRCGSDDHYEETVSASSRLAPVVANSLAELMDPSHEPPETPKGVAGPTQAPMGSLEDPEDAEAGLWVDTSRSAGYEENEDTSVRVSLPSELSGCYGFLDGDGNDQGSQPKDDSQGFYVDLDGDCEYSEGDAVVFAEAWAVAEGQPHWRPD